MLYQQQQYEQYLNYYKSILNITQTFDIPQMPTLYILHSTPEYPISNKILANQQYYKLTVQYLIQQTLKNKTITCSEMHIKIIIIFKYGTPKVTYNITKANNDKNQQYKHLVKIIPSSNKNYFDKEVKSYIYALENSNSRIILPASDQKQLALHQKYLVLHVYLPVGTAWSMELGITDIDGVKRRINFTTVQGKHEVKFFSVRYPLDNLERGVWLFLAFNLHSFIQIFKGQVYRSLDHITIGSHCKLRRIFTMKQFVQWQIPKSFWLNNQIQQQFQLIQYKQLYLPKINKSVISQQSSPTQADRQKQKQLSIKHSKSNLTRSQIVNKSLRKNNVIVSSPVKTKIDPMPRQKISVSSKVGIINQNKMKQLARNTDIVKKNQIFVNRVIQSKIIPNKIDQKVKSTPKKSPTIQKSFQQDQALNYKPFNDSSVNFQTSNQSFVHIQIKNSNKYQKWQKQQQLLKPKQKIQQIQQIGINDKTQLSQQLANPKQKISSRGHRTILTKQNSKNKIITNQKVTELELIYDEMVGCYYHPETHTYYQIKP